MRRTTYNDDDNDDAVTKAVRMDIFLYQGNRSILRGDLPILVAFEQTNIFKVVTITDI